jgi:hypothetical protein
MISGGHKGSIINIASILGADASSLWRIWPTLTAQGRQFTREKCARYRLATNPGDMCSAEQCSD